MLRKVIVGRAELHSNWDVDSTSVVQKQSEAGFTLIELLVVVAIIGILAAIAVPQFREYRQRAFNNRAIADLGNIRSAQEAYFADREQFAESISSLIGFTTTSAGVSLTMGISGASWEANTYHPLGTKTYCYNNVDLDGKILTLDGTAASCP